MVHTSVHHSIWHSSVDRVGKKTWKLFLGQKSSQRIRIIYLSDINAASAAHNSESHDTSKQLQTQLRSARVRRHRISTSSLLQLLISVSTASEQHPLSGVPRCIFAILLSATTFPAPIILATPASRSRRDGRRHARQDAS